MTRLENLAYDLISGSDIEALSDKDLAAVFALVCGRKRPQPRATMVHRVACDISAWRRKVAAGRRAGA